ncbi:hypothetical protein, unknown function [Leishmania tarentolae]|uniref:Uncharacterized protein n=1 Tax=Leishmania tarentolae TaxID=5689 RepID=A0A640KCF6_LEITA|nr:hypothetical protein, unknown function [Leishmania tarentolae]
MSAFPDAVDFLGANGLLVVSSGDGDVPPSLRRVMGRSIFDGIIQVELEKILSYAIPIAAKTSIRDADYDLGGSLPPVNGSWSQVYKWAIALIIISSIIVFAVVGVICTCIVFERRLEARSKLEGKKHNDPDDDVISSNEYDARSWVEDELHAAEENDDSSHSSYNDEGEEDERSRSDDEV